MYARRYVFMMACNYMYMYAFIVCMACIIVCMPCKYMYMYAFIVCMACMYTCNDVCIYVWNVCIHVMIQWTNQEHC